MNMKKYILSAVVASAFLVGFAAQGFAGDAKTYPGTQCQGWAPYGEIGAPPFPIDLFYDQGSAVVPVFGWAFCPIIRDKPNTSTGVSLKVRISEYEGPQLGEGPSEGQPCEGEIPMDCYYEHASQWGNGYQSCQGGVESSEDPSIDFDEECTGWSEPNGVYSMYCWMCDQGIALNSYRVVENNNPQK
jgi:hypothetical protein